MIKNRNKFTVISVALIITILGFIFIDMRKRVLILHSYNNDYTWVNQINQGIDRVMSDSRPKIVMKEHYMDLKNHQDEQFRIQAEKQTLQLIIEWCPDVIIISDDIGQKLIGSKFVNDPHISIVFCGVNGTVTKYGYDGADNITGIFERKPLVAIKETLIMMADTLKIPDKKGVVVFVADTSESVTEELPQFLNFDWKPLDFRTPVRANSFTEWKEKIKEVNEYADLILVSDYREFKKPDGTKEIIEPSAIIKWTEQNSKAPILGMSLINVFDGGMVSVFNSGYEQGEVAGKMALKIINGTKAGDIKKEGVNNFLTSVRKSAVGQRGFPLPAMYEALSRESGNLYE